MLNLKTKVLSKFLLTLFIYRIKIGATALLIKFADFLPGKERKNSNPICYLHFFLPSLSLIFLTLVGFSLYLCLFIYLSLSLSFFLSLPFFLRQSLSLFIYLFIFLSLCLFIYLFLSFLLSFFSLSLSFSLSFSPLSLFNFMSLFIYLSVFVSPSLSVTPMGFEKASPYASAFFTLLASLLFLWMESNVILTSHVMVRLIPHSLFNHLGSNLTKALDACHR